MPIKSVEATKKIIKERAIREFFTRLSYRKKNVVDVLLTDRPFDFSGSWKTSFLEAMRWSFRHHYANSEFYRSLCLQKGFDESRIASFEDIWEIPFILSDVFRMYNEENGR